MSFLSGAATSAFTALQDYTPAAARSVMAGIALAGSVQAVEAGDRPIYVSKNIALLVDRSDSIDPNEEKALFRGIAEGLQGEEARAYFKQGLCYALTTIVFSKSTAAAPTEIVCSMDDVKAYAEKTLWDSAASSIPAGAPTVDSDGTLIYTALMRAAKLFGEEEELGISPEMRAVLIVGDGDGTNLDMAKAQRDNLAKTYSAVVNGVVVAAGRNNLLNSYRKHVCSPEKRVSSLAASKCIQVEGFEGVGEGVASVLKPPLY